MRRRPHGPLRLIAGAGLLSALAFACLGGSSASAHPLGNFSVNHLNQLTFTADGVINDVVIDTAEIPTAQARSIVDADGDGSVSAFERDQYGANRCDDFAVAMRLTVDSSSVPVTVRSSSFDYEAGQAGLTTSRLECQLSATVDLSAPRSVAFADDYLTDRVGWHEVTAVGDGATLIESPVPQASVTNGLRQYPADLLSSPLDVRDATFEVQPGGAPSTAAGPASPLDSRSGLTEVRTGIFSGTVDRVQRTFDDLIGRRDLTLGVGLLAIGLALVLGASHAVLPGHGKTVMAAYIAGRQGSVKDAVIVGATVTSTHTGGVLLLGLALTVSTSLAGETVLGYLGVTSGVLIASLGLALLVGAIRHRGSGVFGHGHTHAYTLSDDHAHEHDHSHGPGHSHGPDHSHGPGQAHGPGHAHGHPYQRDVASVASAFTLDRGSLARSAVVGGSTASGAVALHEMTALRAPILVSDDHGHDHDRGHGHGHDRGHRDVGRRGLIGMGIAGGLVPSPSALIILLSAIALGRTWFGILLVIGYGVGMAGTLTLAGVLLVTMRDRYQERIQQSSGRLRNTAQRWAVIGPYFTASLVFVVGLGLAFRSLGVV